MGDERKNKGIKTKLSQQWGGHTSYILPKVLCTYKLRVGHSLALSFLVGRVTRSGIGSSDSLGFPEKWKEKNFLAIMNIYVAEKKSILLQSHGFESWILTNVSQLTVLFQGSGSFLLSYELPWVTWSPWIVVPPLQRGMLVLSLKAISLGKKATLFKLSLIILELPKAPVMWFQV